MLALAAGGSALAQPTKTLTGHVPNAVTRISSLGRENTSDRLKIAIGLPLRNQDALTNLLHQLYDPASPNYRHYLTPAEFTAQFGPTEAQYEEVIQFARRNGFSVTTTHPNRVVLDVEASVADVERALHVEMRSYNHPTESRTFHAPSVEPTVDLTLPILHISGLDDYSLPHPKFVQRPASMLAKATPQSGSGPGGAYRGGDFRAAYAVGPLTGAGQSVGLLQFDGYYASDIAAYESQAGLSPVQLVNVAIDGGVPNPGSGNGEVSLDIEMVLAMAPGVSKIIVYEAPNPSPWVDLLSRMANDNLAKQLSCSWGGGGPDPTAEQIFVQMALQGQSFFNASGDSDAFTGAVDFPADSTNVTQVGGTTLTTTGPGGAYVSETVWNWGLHNGSYVGSSGGVSTTYALPSYQQGISMNANLGSTTMRNIPDVALTGDNVYVVYGNGSSGTFGGTSCAAPLWAGLTALMNQQAAGGGKPPVGFLNPAIYAIGKSNPNYTSIFHDITTGNNFTPSSPSKYSAVPGYDLCTGWGTPVGANLINTLTIPALFPSIIGAGTVLVEEGCQPTNGVIDSGETVTVNFVLMNVGTASTTNLVVTLLATNGAGLPSGPQNYGAIIPGAGGAVGKLFTFTALGTCGGAAVVTLQLQDGADDLGTVTFGFPLGKTVAVFQENFDGSTSLPSGWTGSGTSPWVISTAAHDSSPNAAFATEPGTAQVNRLISPPIGMPAGPAAQLSFRNNYNMESSPSSGYDGGVLDIKIGSGAFVDILSAGGSFVTGGYNLNISMTSGNSLRGRRAWSGNSGGFISTIVNLPASASGQTVQLRWSCGTDSSTPGSGWFIDTVAISNVVCCSGETTDLAIGSSISPAIATISSNVTFTLSVTNLGTGPASSVVVTDALPTGFTFTTASVSQGTWGNSGNVFNASLGAMANQATATLTLQATATTPGTWTNTANVYVGAADANSLNNTAISVSSINSPPTISAISNVVTTQDVPAGPIGFVIDDLETPASSLTLSAASSNPSLIDSAHIVFGGSGANPTVTLTPLANQFGSATITLGVSDGLATTLQSFTFSVYQINHPAVLVSIPDFVVIEKNTLMFTNKAADADQPTQILTYSLSNAPAGAAVTSATGIFSWTPTEAQGPSTNLITLIVTDNGTPPLSTFQDFTVAVLESNEPPVLAPISDQVIYAAMTLSLSNSVADPDIPSNNLTYAISPGLTGASIDPASGLFQWTPDASFAGSTNSVTIVVTDDNPSAVNAQHLSDAKSFLVFVAPPPLLSVAPLSNGVVALNWNSLPGQSYRLQYNSLFGDTNWTDFTPDIKATDTNSSQTDSTLADPERFYRLLVLP